MFIDLLLIYLKSVDKKIRLQKRFWMTVDIINLL